MLMNAGRLAKLNYMANGFRVLVPGDHVLCAVSGAPIALDDLRFTTAVPEPATVGLMLIGLAAVGAGAARRRRD